MSTRNIPELVRILRETTLPQTTHHLARPPKDGKSCSFCALGALGHEKGLFTLVVERTSNGKHYTVDTHKPGDRETYVGYIHVARELGLTVSETDEILEWNDEERLTFAQIADKIEAEFPA